MKAHVRDDFSLPQTDVHVAATAASSGRALVSVKRGRHGGSSQRETYPSLPLATLGIPGDAVGIIDDGRVVQVVRDETLAVFVDARERTPQRLPKGSETCAQRVRRGCWPVSTLQACRVLNPTRERMV